ncbi:MAG: ribonuclease P protein component [Acidimicrobiia bacterium]
MTRAANDSRPETPFESLRSPVRFREVLRHGGRRTVGDLTVVSLSSGGPGVRVGLVAGRRLGSAVSRNRIKRRVRHACRHVQFSPGWDHVVLPGPRVADVPFTTLVEWIGRAVNPR